MTKKQKKELIKYLFIFIAGAAFLISRRLGTSKLTDAPQQDKSYSYVHFIDASQGDCTLIETHDGLFALIDASTGTASEDVISYLENEGVQSLEFVLFTHPHEDHIGGGDEVLDNFNVKTVYLNGKAETTSCFERLMQAIKQSKATHGTAVIKPENDDTFMLGDIEFTVLSDGDEFEDLNNSSICLKMEHGKSTFLFTGDAEKQVENYILERGTSISAEVFKSAHHGSSTSNSSRFIAAVNPLVAVTSCGRDNDYGHPHDEVTQLFDDRGITHLRTDLDGDVVIAFDKESISILG